MRLLFCKEIGLQRDCFTMRCFVACKRIQVDATSLLTDFVSVDCSDLGPRNVGPTTLQQEVIRVRTEQRLVERAIAFGLIARQTSRDARLMRVDVRHRPQVSAGGRVS